MALDERSKVTFGTFDCYQPSEVKGLWFLSITNVSLVKTYVKYNDFALTVIENEHFKVFPHIDTLGNKFHHLFKFDRAQISNATYQVLRSLTSSTQ